jgi:hypothetical protein
LRILACRVGTHADARCANLSGIDETNGRSDNNISPLKCLRE